MITIILQGIAMGFILSLMVGPVFFQLLQICIENNSRTGFIYVAGAWLSDFLCILLVIFAWSKLSEIEARFHYISGWITSFMLVVFGVISFFKKVKIEEREPLSSVAKNSFHFATGFIINTLNPLVTIYWLAIASNMEAMNIKTTSQVLLFFASIWLTLIATDFIKIAFAKKLKQLLNVEKLQLLNQVLGISLVGCGVILWLKM